MPRQVTKPLDLPPRESPAQSRRADLIFYGVDHSGPSFVANIFLNNPQADEKTPLDAANGYAGHFAIFGHNGCAGDAGHCDAGDEPRDPFDHDLPHPLTPQTQSVEITEALALVKGRRVVVTFVPVVPHRNGPRISKEATIESVRLVTYETSVSAPTPPPA